MKTALRMFIAMMVLTGVLYPLLITAIAKIAFPFKAEGQFVAVKGKKTGSLLIGQKFESDRYFWPRPSAVDYNPLPSGGSNLGWTSDALKQAVEKRREKLQKAPAELLFASGSGLDPHISIETAYYQIDRIAAARGLERSRIKELIDDKIQNPQLGFLGPKYVNVLALNLALDEIEAHQ